MKPVDSVTFPVPILPCFSSYAPNPHVMHMLVPVVAVPYEWYDGSSDRNPTRGGGNDIVLVIFLVFGIPPG